jgi:uncharacterized protein YkwD
MRIKMASLILIAFCVFVSCETFGSFFDNGFSPFNSNSSNASSGVSSSPQGTSGASTGNITTTRRANPDTANWNIETLDTAKDADYLSAIEKDVVLEMNKVRSDPKKYAELYIQTELRYYSGNLYQKPGEIAIQTQEGRKAVESCVAALSKMKGVQILQPELGLSRGTKDHTADQGKTGKTGHDGGDKSTPFTRIERYGKGYNTAGENLAYGPVTGQAIVVQLLIDDGVPSRGHRTNIMNQDFSQAGVSFGAHPQFRTMCAIVYANGYTSN